MRWVDQAVTRPHRCAVVPYVGNGSGHRFLDTGQELDLEHVYISDVGCELIAKSLGWVSPNDLQHERNRAVFLQARIDELEVENAELAEFKRGVGILAPHGYGAKKLPGRPKKDKQPAA